MFFSKKMVQSSDSASASTSVISFATASTNSFNEIEGLEQKIIAWGRFFVERINWNSVECVMSIFFEIFDYIFLEARKRHYSNWRSK